MLKTRVREALVAALARLDLAPESLEVTATDRPEFGDYATNVAFTLGRSLGKSPRQVGQMILEELEREAFARVELAGAGFLNFTLKDEALHEVVRSILRRGEAFGRLDDGAGRRVQVEFVSANPTGPLTVGHGRNAVIGDCLANLFAALGWQVTREYYFNDGGRQMRVLGESVRLRFLELLGRDVEFPEECYQGAYLIEIAQKILKKHGPEVAERDWRFFKEIAQEEIFADIRRTLARLGIEMDVYTNEADFYESGAIWRVLERLKAAGLAYEKDGAVWFAATRFGAAKDRVLVRANGEPTYRLPDIAYHVEKLERGFDLVLDVLGADHVAQTPDIVHAVGALGYPAERIEPVFYQFVTLVRGGEAVKMSTRKAEFVTLDELIDEVGSDAVRYFLAARSVDSHIHFDLELAKSQTKDNPVFYVQYAHTRVAGILRELDEAPDPEADLSPLNEPEVRELIKKLDAYPEALREAARLRSPHVLAAYAHQLAALFHGVYERCRVRGEAPEVARARLALVGATGIVLRSALGVLGVSAPERM